MNDWDVMCRENADYIDALYRQYRSDPASVDAPWRGFFATLDGEDGDGGPTVAAGARRPPQVERSIGVLDLIHSYRELGHLIANLDPLGHNPSSHPLLEPTEFGFRATDLDRMVTCPGFKGCARATIRELTQRLRATYCGTLGVEYMDIADKDQRTWLQERMEPHLNQPALKAADRIRILSKLTEAEGFEQFLHTKYVGQKRFSLEGAESLIPMLDVLVEEAAARGVQEIVMGMAHRGRLNVLVNVLRKPYEMVFSEFEGMFLPPYVSGDGDVKYHLGYSRDCVTRAGHTVHLSLCSNPSHLEAVDPVVAGIARAKQYRRGDTERTQVVPVLIHGDAAFTGQGVIAELLTLSELDAYRTGGMIHIIVNNQIGFTTSPGDYRAARYPTDVAKVTQAPVFHVNGDDPEAAVQAAQLAVGFRNAFKKDVIIDLVCYRKHGHNETDDPTFTQPVLYAEIAAHPSVRHLYSQRLVAAGVVSAEDLEREARALRELFEDALSYARDFRPPQQVFALGGAWRGMQWAGADWRAHTAVPTEMVERVSRGVLRLPPGFTVHPKVRRLMEERAAMLRPEGMVDWAGAEMLAFGTILLEGTKIRLSGQDSGRGTFSQRHAVLRDLRTGAKYVPLDHLAEGQGHFAVIDSMLSEYAVLGFEYGFSCAEPHTLVIWEAQFGDFANAAQVIIDQFIASAESKWQRMSGIVLLLPHGYEGQGPEHSSARLERYLQLCAEDNLQVCNLTTPAQYFHAVRRQMHRNFRKPLILMSPKSLLRHKLVASPVTECTEGGFRLVIDETEPLPPARVRRVLLCSGKVYFDLLVARRERVSEDIAIVRVEQLYPFPAAEIRAALQRYAAAREVFWVQEEPENMGAWQFIEPRLRPLCGSAQSLLYAGRDAAASPATGSYKVHTAEATQLIDYALGKTHAR